MEIGIFGSFNSEDKGVSLGPELVVNGGFDTDTAWTKGAGVTILGSKLVVNTSGVCDTYQGIGSKFGSKYFVSFEVSGYFSGNGQVTLGYGVGADKISFNGSGFYSGIIRPRATLSNSLLITCLVAAVFNVDNVSVRGVSGDLGANMVGDPVEFLG